MERARWEHGLLVALVGAQVALSSAFWFVADDAYISYRYARNWASGHGVRFNLGDAVPVEGYSNFLWVAIAAAFEAVGVPAPLAMPVVSIALGALLLLGVHRAARETLGWGAVPSAVAAVAVLLHPSFPIWCTSGLATMAEALGLFVVVERLVLARGERPWVAVLAGVGLALVRTEGVLWLGVALVFTALAAALDPPRRAERLRAAGRVLGVVAVVYGAYFAWRYGYYGDLVANTAHAKVDLGPDTLRRGMNYVIGFWLEDLAAPVALLLVPCLFAVSGWRGLLAGAFAVGPAAYAVLVGGDFMTMGRMMVNGVPFAALAIGGAAELGLRRGRAWAPGAALALVGLGALPLLDVQLVPEHVREPFRVRFNTRTFRTERQQWEFMKLNAEHWALLGVALDAVTAPGESLVLGAVGAVGYHSDLYIFDRYGLVTREVALRETRRSAVRQSPGHDKEVPITFFLEDEPTYLRAELLVGDRALRRVGRAVAEWRARGDLLRDYAPVVRSTELDGVPLHVVLLARTDDAAAAWEAWPDQVAQLTGRAPAADDTDPPRDSEE